MLDRVLEQEIMDTELDAREYATYDNSEVNEAFVARALELAPKMGSALDIGTGPGDIAVLLAKRAPGLDVLAIDLGEHMLAMARANVQQAGLGQRVVVERADAKATGRPAKSFDLIISNSLVHHIPEPAAMFRELRRIARPGAGLFIKDLHRPETEAELQYLVETYSKGCTEYQRKSFEDSLRAGLTVAEVASILRSLDWPGLDVCRCSDRHWCIERRASLPG
jgi:ubiquinone/menaquinone biosynthesis C-methylase UbiE